MPNGSFEDTVNCPQNGEMSNAKYFSSPTLSSPDYFNVCALPSYNTSVPNNLAGYQEPRSGVGYGGIVAYGLGTNYKEYIQTSLTETLKYGRFYSIKYYVSLGSYASVACNNLGLHFSVENISTNNYLTLIFNEALYCNSIVKDTLGWVELSFVYYAQGNENYLVIGNFKDDADTDTLTNVGGVGDNYYYIDDISVTELEYQIPNVFTPNEDGFNDFFYIDTSVFIPDEITILNRWGNVVYYSVDVFSWNGRNKLGSICSDGTYFYVIKTKTNTFEGFVELISN